MADLIVQSRFAGLDIEDDDASPICIPKPKSNKPENTKKCDVSKKAKSNGNKSQNANKKKKQKQNGPSSEQWEQWKQKDEQLVDGSFETELQQAILLSKLDYEEKKDVYKHLKKEADAENKTNRPETRTNNKKQKKKTVMSLEQFNDMGEMKDKAEVLVEVERLRAVQAELTTELESLHTDLEKERSRNTDNRSRDKKYPNKKKTIRFDVSSEALVSKESACGTD
ncbi:unnamed protein product, partial [Iphiclides podalirius]